MAAVGPPPHPTQPQPHPTTTHASPPPTPHLAATPNPTQPTPSPVPCLLQQLLLAVSIQLQHHGGGGDALDEGYHVLHSLQGRVGGAAAAGLDGASTEADVAGKLRRPFLRGGTAGPAQGMAWWNVLHKLARSWVLPSSTPVCWHTLRETCAVPTTYTCSQAGEEVQQASSRWCVAAAVVKPLKD